jgi:hypothetical protein
MRRKWLKRTSKSKQEQETNKKQGIEEPATPFSRINKKEKIPESANRKKRKLQESLPSLATTGP